MTKHLVCKESDLPLNNMKPVKLDDRNVLVYHLEDGFFATQSNCTHVFAPLKKGKIVDGCKIECPFHRARFDIRTGEVVDWANFPPGIQVLNVVRKEKALETFGVSVEDGNVYVTM
ncbi:MAG: Rieske 2Fe-2S domain-containing protein [Ketobacteraceae bacterium]|nr:Rieske 2Fe-2S domain-containing protein [Ketobacteraceae bacterium]